MIDIGCESAWYASCPDLTVELTCKVSQPKKIAPSSNPADSGHFIPSVVTLSSELRSVG
jgi:hypothetical protein